MKVGFEAFFVLGDLFPEVLMIRVLVLGGILNGPLFVEALISGSLQPGKSPRVAWNREDLR